MHVDPKKLQSQKMCITQSELMMVKATYELLTCTANIKDMYTCQFITDNVITHLDHAST